MTTYTSVFGSDTIPPSDFGYAAVTLSANTTFYWPEDAQNANLIAAIMEVTASGAYNLTFPDATLVSNGRDCLVRNVGATTFTLKDSAGGTIGTVAAGEAKYVYLKDNSTAAGTWAIFTYGTGTSAADAAALAGYGLTATGSTLSQAATTASKSASYAVVSTDRASTITFDDTGVVTCSFLAAATAGNGFFCYVTNQGSGTVTLDPDGSEEIDGATTKALAPGESCMVVCTSTAWVTIGYGRSTQFQFTKLVLDISAGTPFTLSSTQAENKLLQLIGTISGAVTINVPAVVAVYYVECSYTGGFTTTIKTAAGTGVALSNTDRAILYCDGTNVVSAQTASVPAGSLAGGAAGQIPYQTGADTTGFSAAGTTGQILISGGTGAPTWSDGGLITYGYSSKATPVNGDSLLLSDSAATNGPKKLLWSDLKVTLAAYFDTLYAAINNVAVDTHAASTKATPVDADELPLADSAASFALKNLTWANLKAGVFSAWGALINGGTDKATPVDADAIALMDSAASNATKKLTWANIKATLKTYFDTLYTGGGGEFKNLLINPRGAVYQRAVASTADDTYFADCWYALTQTGAITPSKLTDPEDGYPTGIRLTQAQASAQRFGFAQIIEGKNCKHLRGGSATLTPRVRISNSQAIRYAILGWTGTEDSVTSDVVNDWTSATYTAGNFFLGANLSVLAVGAVTPSANTWTSLTALTATMGSTFNNAIVMVWTEGTAAQNMTLDFDYVQLEAGQTATNFETRSIGQEWALSQRYLPAFNWTSGGDIVGPGQNVSTNAAYVDLPFLVEARVKPTGISVSNVAHFLGWNAVSSSAGAPSGITMSANTSKYAALLSCTGFANNNLTAGEMTHLFANNASAQILFTGCEL